MYEYLERRYALALYEVAEKSGKTEKFLQDLKGIVNLINESEEFIQVIKHPEISTSKKKALFTEIFKGKIDDELLSFLLILINKGRILQLEEKLIEMEKIHLERNNKVLAQVKTVVPLLEEEKQELIEKLNKKYNKTIILEEELEPELIGGVFIRVGDDVIDGSVKNRLMEMKKIMLKEE